MFCQRKGARQRHDDVGILKKKLRTTKKWCEKKIL